MASYFVDIDSITTNADSLTYFRGHSSSAYDIITEVEVQCDQDFESGKVSMRERTYSYGGVSQTNEQSDNEETVVNSLMGQSVKYVCHK